MEASRHTCAFEGCDRPKGKRGKKRNDEQKYGKYCYRRHTELHDTNHSERRREWNRLHPRRLTYEQRKKNKLRKNACEQCGWSEARCDLHRITHGGPYTEENTVTLCPNCHRAQTEKARLQNGFGGRDRPSPTLS
ncbi:MAG: HNH endonuclease [Rubrobacteraceae bacterium]|nr:HNH endonuclease [Rubrobacter sp.]